MSIGGIDGTGKSTTQRMLIDHLKSRGHDVVGFAEPYHGFVKELLETSHDPWTDVLLFALDRWLLKPTISRWLSQRKVLVSSRSLYCSVAYQGAQGVPWEDILSANNWESLTLPNLFIILDADPRLAYSRCSGEERFEDEAFLARVRDEYVKIFESGDLFPSSIILIDANATIDEVFQNVRATVDEALKARGI